MIRAICLLTVTGAETSPSIFVVSIMRVSPSGEPNSVRLTDQARSLTHRIGHPPSLHAFVTEHVEPGSRVITGGWQGYRGIDKLGYSHEPRSQRAAENARLIWPHLGA